MSEWKEFHKEPINFDKYENIWICDGKEKYIVDQHNYDCWDKESLKKYIYWMPIEEPELPKKSDHHCVDGCYHCIEKVDGLWCGNVSHTHAFQVKFCPFCGYKTTQ